jgi:outer membrane biosynthesis protein TonB
MLRQAAMDAVKQWKYKPYSVDGEAVEADTEINVKFTPNDKACRQTREGDARRR